MLTPTTTTAVADPRPATLDAKLVGLKVGVAKTPTGQYKVMQSRSGTVPRLPMEAKEGHFIQALLMFDADGKRISVVESIGLAPAGDRNPDGSNGSISARTIAAALGLPMPTLPSYKELDAHGKALVEFCRDLAKIAPDVVRRQPSVTLVEGEDSQGNRRWELPNASSVVISDEAF